MKQITLFSEAANLKRRLRQHLKALGFKKQPDGTLQPADQTKETYRHLHRLQRQAKLKSSEKWLEVELERFKHCFASGNDIDPANIRPEIEEICAGDHKLGYLFRLAALTWSVPVSNGYGRRMRFLVWDRHNNKLIGLIALADPVFNMSARDNAIGWTSKQRSARLVNVMDACVLGAIPPYNQLLCGKMIACIVRSKEIAKAFEAKYAATKGIISGEKKHAKLLCVTTTSALGRSSVYNRLTLGSIKYFDRVGYTEGWGHFQIPDDLFEKFRKFLKRKQHRYANGHKFGQGPNWRIRTTRAALTAMGVSSDILKHNLKREVFVCSLADNAFEVLNGKEPEPSFSNLQSISEISRIAIARWIIPRSERRPDYLLWTQKQTLELIRNNVIPVATHTDVEVAVA